MLAPQRQLPPLLHPRPALAPHAAAARQAPPPLRVRHGRQRRGLGPHPGPDPGHDPLPVAVLRLGLAPGAFPRLGAAPHEPLAPQQHLGELAGAAGEAGGVEEAAAVQGRPPLLVPLAPAHCDVTVGRRGEGREAVVGDVQQRQRRLQPRCQRRRGEHDHERRRHRLARRPLRQLERPADAQRQPAVRHKPEPGGGQ